MITTLHWQQRIALVRHNLHAAHRSGDFTFFKTLQAQALFDNTNHVATLSATLGDEADSVLSGLDDLNASIAHVHEDAFRNVYNSLKTYLHESGAADNSCDGKSKVFVDVQMQKQMADHAIDKATSSAIALIQQQPVCVQDTAAAVWITGTTIIADSVEVVLQQLAALESNMHDFIRLEESWNGVKASVGYSVSALKGVFNLMSGEPDSPTVGASSRSSSFSGTMFRRLSNAFVSAPAPASHSRSSSASVPTSRSSSFSQPSHHSNRSSSFHAPEYKTPNYFRNSASSACPTSLPSGSGWRHTELDTIPPTPAATGDVGDQEVNPFDTSVPPMPEIPSLMDIRSEQAVMSDNAAFIVIITTMQGIFITATSVSLVLLVDCTIPIIFMISSFLGNLFLDQRFQQATEFCMQANEEVLVANNLSQTARLGHIRQWRGG
ncbi:hypothetical protein D6D11_03408 [Aureobasidium pullulans]|nr:hypothetical protein D6D11_03408 [Aureobasidium pullulans]